MTNTTIYKTTRSSSRASVKNLKALGQTVKGSDKKHDLGWPVTVSGTLSLPKACKVRSEAPRNKPLVSNGKGKPVLVTTVRSRLSAV